MNEKTIMLKDGKTITFNVPTEGVDENTLYSVGKDAGIHSYCTEIIIHDNTCIATTSCIDSKGNKWQAIGSANLKIEIPEVAMKKARTNTIKMILGIDDILVNISNSKVIDNIPVVKTVDPIIYTPAPEKVITEVKLVPAKDKAPYIPPKLLDKSVKSVDIHEAISKEIFDDYDKHRASGKGQTYRIEQINEKKNEEKIVEPAKQEEIKFTPPKATDLTAYQINKLKQMKIDIGIKENPDLNVFLSQWSEGKINDYHLIDGTNADSFVDFVYKTFLGI